MDLHQVPVVQTRAPHRMLIDTEAQRAHEVQRRSGGSAGAGDRAGVGRDLRLDQDHLERRRDRLGSELEALGHSRSYDRA